METIIKNTLPIIAVTFLMAFLFMQSKKKAKEDAAGNLILKMPKAYGYIGWFVNLAGIAVLVFGLLYAQPNEKVLVVIASLFAFLVGSYLVAHTQIAYLKITDYGLTKVSIFKKETFIEWNKISEVTYGQKRKELKVISKENKIMAPLHLVGFPELINKLEENTGKSLGHLNIPE